MSLSTLKLFYLVVISSWIVEVISHHRFTYGSSGVACEGADRRRCLSQGAQCEGGRCVCTDGRKGHGNFNCREPKFWNGRTHSDPMFQSMNGEVTSLPLPCRYLLAHVTTTFTGWPDSRCHLVVHVHNDKRRGKMFTAGLDWALRVEGDSLPRGYGAISARITGKAVNGTYDFDELGQLDFSPHGPWADRDTPLVTFMPGDDLFVRHDPYNNLAKMTVPSCGIYLSFRPADHGRGSHQAMVPGVNINLNPKHKPYFQSTGRALSSPPWAKDALAIEAALFNLTVQQALLRKAFMADVPQNHPGAAAACEAPGPALAACPPTRLPRAMASCNFLLARPKLVHCLDKTDNAQHVLDLYARCLDAFCSASVEGCQDVQAAVRVCRQKDDAHDFLRLSTCLSLA